MVDTTSHEAILILDFGSQLTQLIARRLRELKVYCEIAPYHQARAALARLAPKAVILSGGPASLHQKEAPKLDGALARAKLPILGICYGHQALVKALGGGVEPARQREFGAAEIHIKENPGPLLDGIGRSALVWMSHSDRVTSLPPGFAVIAHNPASPFAAIADEQRKFYGVQFHPEAFHTNCGRQILRNFAYKIAHCQGNWSMEAFRDQAIGRIRSVLGKDTQVICALSGGVDSAVTACLLHEAIGERVHCVLVDTGLLRHNEARMIAAMFARYFQIPLRIIQAQKRFFAQLKGVRDPEKKRKIIGREFINVFCETAQISKKIKFLAQGTLYPDVIESVSPTGSPSATIKSHHNVGGLPEKMALGLIEPLRELFKDEVRVLGQKLGLPREFLSRHPFPGPGLGIRVIGPVSRKKVAILQQADEIYLDEICKAGLYDEIWQAFAILLPVRAVGVMGDQRSYEQACVLRAVTASDGMTAECYPFPYDILQPIARRIVNETRGINRVLYDITSKPPGSIEWE